MNFGVPSVFVVLLIFSSLALALAQEASDPLSEGESSVEMVRSRVLDSLRSSDTEAARRILDSVTAEGLSPQDGLELRRLRRLVRVYEQAPEEVDAAASREATEITKLVALGRVKEAGDRLAAAREKFGEESEAFSDVAAWISTIKDSGGGDSSKARGAKREALAKLAVDTPDGTAAALVVTARLLIRSQGWKIGVYPICMAVLFCAPIVVFALRGRYGYAKAWYLFCILLAAVPVGAVGYVLFAATEVRARWAGPLLFTFAMCFLGAVGGALSDGMSYLRPGGGEYGKEQFKRTLFKPILGFFAAAVALLFMIASESLLFSGTDMRLNRWSAALAALLAGWFAELVERRARTEAERLAGSTSE